MLANLTGWHALLILAIVLLVFGSSKLPALARSVGQSVRILKDEVAEGEAQQQTSSADTRSHHQDQAQNQAQRPVSPVSPVAGDTAETTVRQAS
ncbi:MAG: Sec-independent protein translocase TatA [Nocardioides sp.]|nr:Sec-independent protein translocase TatA [Nocardioides sp.]